MNEFVTVKTVTGWDLLRWGSGIVIFHTTQGGWRKSSRIIRVEGGSLDAPTAGMKLIVESGKTYVLTGPRRFDHLFRILTLLPAPPPSRWRRVVAWLKRVGRPSQPRTT